LCERTWYVLEIAAIFLRALPWKERAAGAAARLRNSRRFILFLLHGRFRTTQDFHVRRQSKHVVRQALVDLNAFREDFKKLLAIPLPLNREGPHDAAAHVPVLCEESHLFVAILGLLIAPLGHLPHRQLCRD